MFLIEICQGCMVAIPPTTAVVICVAIIAGAFGLWCLVKYA